MRLKRYEDDDMIEGKSFYFHGTVVTIRTQEQRMKNQSNYNRQSEQREICEKKKTETRRYNIWKTGVITMTGNQSKRKYVKPS